MNHGIFTFANNAKEAYNLMIKYVSLAEREVKKFKSKKIKQIKKFNTKFNPHEVAPILRGLLSENKDQKFVINYRLNKHLKYFINGKKVRSYSSKGTATPDHVIRVKPFPLIITPKKNSSIEEFKKTAEKAFENYRKLGGTYELLIVGENMWRDERHQAKGVRYSGRLNDEKLVEAISNAEALLYLPFFEGFGVPIVEAMACGVPVVASNCTSVPEVCGSAAAALVDPNDFGTAAEALLKLENDADWKRSRKEAGLKRAGDFSWDKSASILNNEIKKLLNG